MKRLCQRGGTIYKIVHKIHLTAGGLDSILNNRATRSNRRRLAKRVMRAKQTRLRDGRRIHRATCSAPLHIKLMSWSKQGKWNGCTSEGFKSQGPGRGEDWAGETMSRTETVPFRKHGDRHGTLLLFSSPATFIILPSTGGAWWWLLNPDTPIRRYAAILSGKQISHSVVLQD
jgi:hypothetical protein